MDIEIVAIGNELLSGYTANTNAAYISNELLKAGYPVKRHTVLPDDEAILRQGLREALARSRVVITTGGLGPTVDDLTRPIAAELFGSDFYLNEEVAEELKKRYGNISVSLEQQATVPKKALILKNPVGTAPGLIFHTESATLICLPGIPNEMKVMLSSQVIEFLHSQFPLKVKHCRRSLNLFNISESLVDPTLRKVKSKFPNIELGIYPSSGVLNIEIVSLNGKAAEADSAYQEIALTFASNFFESPNGRIEEAVHEALIRRKKTLSVAESCTGGALAASLTRLAGASEYFIGSFVVYSNLLKTSVLEVPEQMLKDKGAVSQEVAKAMVLGLLKKTGSDYGAAVTGIAGPTGGTPEKPVGTVWIAVAKKGGEPNAIKLHCFGNRVMIIDRSVNAVLSELYKALSASE